MSSGQPQGALPVTVYCNAPASQDGAHVVGLVDCPSLGLFMVAVLLDPAQNRIALQTDCGCSISVGLSSMVSNLAAVVAARDAVAPMKRH